MRTKTAVPKAEQLVQASCANPGKVPARAASLGMPRNIRLRLQCVVPVGKKQKTGNTPSNGQTTKEQNRSGKVGTWLRPAQELTEMPPLPSTMYSDVRGSTHWSLDAGMHSQLLSQFASTTTEIRTPLRTAPQRTMISKYLMKAVSKNSVGKEKPWQTGRGSRAMKHTHQINQPR